MKSKWAVNCSRSCARKAQHLKNHGGKREEKECEICSTPFVTTNWNREKKYCSSKCAATARFGEKDFQKMKNKAKKILNDPNYLVYIQKIASSICLKFKRGDEFKEEIIQEYFLKLWEGNNTTIENVARTMIRKEIKRGVTGKWDSDFSFVATDALAFVKVKKSELTSFEFRDFILDLFDGLNDFERRFISLYLKGFKDREVMSAVRERYPISNEAFYSEKKRLFREIDYSSYGEFDEKKYFQNKNYQ